MRAAYQPSSDTARNSTGASGWNRYRKAPFASSSSVRRAVAGSGRSSSSTTAPTNSTASTLIRSKGATPRDRGALHGARRAAARGPSSPRSREPGRDLVDGLEAHQREVGVRDLDAVGALDERHQLREPEAVQDALVHQRLAVGGQQLAVAADDGGEMGAQRLPVDVRRVAHGSAGSLACGASSESRLRLGWRAILPLEVLSSHLCGTTYIRSQRTLRRAASSRRTNLMILRCTAGSSDRLSAITISFCVPSSSSSTPIAATRPLTTSGCSDTMYSMSCG